MTDHEKEILDKIKQSTEKTPVPESLAPDQIMKMLEEHNSTQASGHIPKKHGFSRGHRMRGGLIAAALVLVVGIGAHIRQQNLSSDSATSSTKGSSSIDTSSGKTVVHAPIVPAPLRILQQPLHVLWILHFPIPTSAQRVSVKQTL